MGEASQSVTANDDLKARIVDFMRAASTEITPGDVGRLPDLTQVGPAGTSIYVAHTPHAAFEQVIHAALAVRRAGFLATPHIAARRISNAMTLRAGLDELRAGGIEHILLVAGDAPQPLGEFTSTLDILESGILERSGITRIGIAGHPEGHGAVSSELLWRALGSKQAFAARTGIGMHIVTQFGLNAGAAAVWQREFKSHDIHLPVHVGIAGPASLSKLIHFAIQCGIGASMHASLHVLLRNLSVRNLSTRNLSAAANLPGLAVSPDQHLLALMASPFMAQFVAPHFFAFGGTVETARWMRQIAAGAFDIDSKAGKFKLRNLRDHD